MITPKAPLESTTTAPTSALPPRSETITIFGREIIHTRIVVPPTQQQPHCWPGWQPRPTHSSFALKQKPSPFSYKFARSLSLSSYDALLGRTSGEGRSNHQLTFPAKALPPFCRLYWKA